MARPRAYEPKPGDRFGYATFLKEEAVPYNSTTRPSGASLRYAVMRCDCGSEYSVQVRRLFKGQGTSCGCRKRANQLDNLHTRLAITYVRHIMPIKEEMEQIRSQGPIAGYNTDF